MEACSVASIAEEGRSDVGVDVFNGLEHAFAEEARLVAVAEFDGFVFAGGGAGGNRGAADRAAFEVHVNFDGGIAAGIDHFAAADFNNGGVVHGICLLYWRRESRKTGVQTQEMRGNIERI